MRIGLVTGEYPPMQGGVGAFAQILARQFVAQGHDVFVFSSREAQNRDHGILLTNQVDQWNLAAVRLLSRWTADLDIDVLNVQFQTAAYNMSAWVHFLPGYIRKTPVVTTFHDLRHPYLFPKAGMLRDWVVMRLARTSQGVIVTNHEDYQRVRGMVNVRMIPIGSNIAVTLPAGFERSIWREKVGAGAGCFLLAHFGFINRSKGIETLLHALALLRDNGQSVRLVMIGGRTGSSDPSNAEYAEEIDGLITELALEELTYWTGYLDDAEVGAHFAASDLVVLPFLDGASYRRGSLMAAIAHSTAILTTAPLAEIQLFRHGENLFFVQPGDSAALARAIAQLAAEPQRLRVLRQGAGLLQSEFDWARIASETLAFYEQITGART